MNQTFTHEYHEPDTTLERKVELLRGLCPYDYKLDIDAWSKVCDGDAMGGEEWCRQHNVKKTVPGGRASGIGSAPYEVNHSYKLVVTNVGNGRHKDLWQALYRAGNRDFGLVQQKYIVLFWKGLHETMMLAELWHWIPPRITVTRTIPKS